MTTTVKTETQKLPYATPSVTEYGTIQDLAQTSAAPNPAADGGGTPNVYAS